MKFRLPSLGFALLVLGGLAGCGKPAPAAKPAPTLAPTPTPVPFDALATKVGLFISQTGIQASFGEDAILGATMAAKEINDAGGIFGHPLELVIRDTESSTDKTKEVVTDLIEKEHVVALIGEIATDRSLAAAPIAQAHGIPMITPGATHEAVTAVGDDIFRTCYTDSFQAKAMSKFATSIDVKRAAVLFDDSNPYGTELAAIFKNDFLANGGQIVAEGTYHAGDQDFSAQLNAIKAQSPEVIFLPSYYSDAAVIIKQARQLGLDLPFLGTDGWDSPQFLSEGGVAVNNSYFSSHFSADSKTPRIAQFVKSYVAAYKTPPPPLAALAYDSVRLVADALKRAGNAQPLPLKTALAATKGFPGVTGSITFDAKRNPTKPTIVIRVQNGKFTYLETDEPH